MLDCSNINLIMTLINLLCSNSCTIIRTQLIDSVFGCLRLSEFKVAAAELLQEMSAHMKKNLLKNHKVESRDHMLSLLHGFNHSADQELLTHTYLHYTNCTQKHACTTHTHIDIYQVVKSNVSDEW